MHILEMAAAHPLVWRKVLLARVLIDIVWYNAIRDAMRGTGCELPWCPKRDEENWEYEGEVISEDTSESCLEAAQSHRVAAQNDMLRAMKDALKVDDKAGMWAKLRRKRLWCTDPNGQPLEGDLVGLAGDKGRFFNEAGRVTPAEWSSKAVRTSSSASSPVPSRGRRRRWRHCSKPSDQPTARTPRTWS